MYQVMRAMINHSVPDIISQQEEEIKKLRMELKEQTGGTAVLQFLLRQSADRLVQEGDFWRGRIREVHRANDKLEATAFRMASRIVISAIRGCKISMKKSLTSICADGLKNSESLITMLMTLKKLYRMLV